MKNMDSTYVVETPSVETQNFAPLQPRSNNLPKDWKYVELGEVVEKPKYGTSKKCTYDDSGTGVLRIPNIGNGVINSSDLKFATFTAEELSTYKLKSGDILVIRSNGSVNIVGKCALVSTSDEKFLYAGYLIMLRPTVGLNSKFLIYCLNSHELRLQIESKAKSTSGVNNINSKELQSLNIPVTTISEQTQIVKEIETRLSVCDNAIKNIDEALEKSEALRQSILKKAFEGKLLNDSELHACRKEPDWEPAEKLLERIKKEKK